MTRPIQAIVHPAALVNNLLVARQAVPAAKIMAVVKANGYGHGLLRVARALEESDGFAVLSVEEAVRLREAGFTQPILLLEGVFESGELSVVSELGLCIVVHSVEQIEMLRRGWSPVKLSVFLKLNTGMHRLGFAPDAFRSALAALQACAIVGQITLMTHFATADEALGVSDQLARFNTLTQGLTFPRTLANSAACLRYPETQGDWVRLGIMLYGASPFATQRAADIGLEPAMSLVSEIISVQNVKLGEQVGYGGTYRAERDMRIGIVACGYADGYPRHAETGTPILVMGQRTRTLGRVSMDMLAVDLGEIPDAGVGSPVTLWGVGLPVEEVARATGTISYELLCARAERVLVIED
ncbi:MAG: alanine racemase [Burkholderiales bacterium]|nr:alanine racemase [Burkholderiales bacterium]